MRRELRHNQLEIGKFYTVIYTDGTFAYDYLTLLYINPIEEMNECINYNGKYTHSRCCSKNNTFYDATPEEIDRFFSIGGIEVSHIPRPQLHYEIF